MGADNSELRLNNLFRMIQITTHTMTQNLVHTMTQNLIHNMTHRRILCRVVIAIFAGAIFLGPPAAWAAPSGGGKMFFNRSIFRKGREVIYEQDFSRITVPISSEARVKLRLTPFLERKGLRVESVQEIPDRGVGVVTMGPVSSLQSTPDSSIRFFKDLAKAAGVKWVGPVFFKGRAVTLPTGRLWVYFPSNTPGDVVLRELKKMGLKRDEDLPSSTRKLVAAVCDKSCGDIVETARTLTDGRAAKASKASKQTTNRVLEVVPELMRRFYSRMKPTDTYYDLQWYLNNTGDNVTAAFSGQSIPGTPLADIGAEAAWDETTGDPSVIIGVIDTGVDCGHQEFAGKCLDGLNAITNEPDGSPPDPDVDMGAGHGSSVASVAAAAVDGEGVVGVCPDCRVVPIRLIEKATFLTDAMILNSFTHSVDEGAGIINNSWGPAAEGFYIPVSSGELEGFEYAATNGRNGLGTLVIYAAGNANQSTSYLGHLQSTFSNVIAVAASDQFDMKSEYSNFGEHITLCAPSSAVYLNPAVYAAEILGNGNVEGDYTSSFGGTSSAAPVVSGIAALVLTLAPELTATELKEVLIATADKIDPDGGRYDGDGHSIKYGYGRVNALRAVLYAQGLDDRPWCADPAPVDDCETHFDEDCDGYINTGCFVSPVMGTPCADPASCGAEAYWECPQSGKQRGLCTYDCTEQPCPPGSTCVDGKCSLECGDNNECPTEFVCSDDELGICLPSCSSNEDCSDEEYCDLDAEICKLATDGKVGSRCNESEDCEFGGFCLSEMMGFQGGYCTRSCSGDDDCDGADRCVFISGYGSFCYKGCNLDGDCRENYICQQAGPRAGTCYKFCERDDHCTGGDPDWEGIVCVVSTGRCIDEREPDAGVPDAAIIDTGVSDSDAGDHPDGGVDASTGDGSSGDGGCGCKVVSSKKSPGSKLPFVPGILMSLTFLAFISRRRFIS